MKHVTTLLILSSLVVLTGCTVAQTPVNTNETGEANTNAQIVVVNTSNESNSNEIVNKNTNADSDGEPDEEIDTSDWLAYTNEEYRFSLKYPGDWILTESNTSVSFRSKDISNIAYTNSFSLTITNKDFETLKSEIEQSDIIGQDISLAKFNNDMVQKNINDIEATTGTHATAIGPVQRYYYIPLNDFSIYIEFFEPSDEINTLIQPVISTLQIK